SPTSPSPTPTSTPATAARWWSPTNCWSRGSCTTARPATRRPEQARAGVRSAPMTQRTRRRQRRRGGWGAKLLVDGAALLAAVAIGVIAVTSWVLDVAADAPPLGSCKPVGKGGDSTLYAADGTRLGRIAASVARTPVSIERIPKKLQLATVAIED